MIKLRCLEVITMLDKTMFFSSEEIERAVINEVLEEVYKALKEKGYNPVNQMAGFLATGDPKYISSYKNSRNKILGIERDKVIKVLLESYMEV